MRDSKNLALMFLLGAFLTGGVLGFTANRYINRDQVCTTGTASSSLRAILSERLRLSAEQQHSVDSILDERSRQYQIEIEPIRPRMEAIKLNARDQIRRVLNEEQRKEFEALLTEMSDTTKNDRND